MNRVPSTYKSKNNHPHDFQILKQLGIVERSKESFSEDDEELFTMKHGSRRATPGNMEMLSESEEEVLFEKDSFIKNTAGNAVPPSEDFVEIQKQVRQTGDVVNQTRRAKNVLSWHLFLLHAASFIFGMCISVIGSTFYSLKEHGFAHSLVSLMSIVTLNALSIIVGTFMGEYLFRRLNAFCVLTVSSLICAISTLLVPWCLSSASTSFVFIVQGYAMGLLYKGIHYVYYVCWKRKYQLYLLLYFSMTLGCALSPIFASSFMANSAGISTRFATPGSVVDSSAVPHLMYKRSVQDVNFTIVNVSVSSTSRPTTISNATVAPDNQTTVSANLTIHTTSTVKITKPLVADGTNIEPKTMMADKNNLRPPPPLVAVTTTTSRPLATTTSPAKNASKQLSSNGATSPTPHSVATTSTVTSPTSTTTIKMSTTTTTAQKITRKPGNVWKNRKNRLNLSSGSESTTFVTVIVSSNNDSPPPSSSSNINGSSSLIDKLWTSISSSRRPDLQQTTTLANNADYIYVMISLCSFLLFMLYFVTCCFSSTIGILRGKFAHDSNGLTSGSTDLYELTFRRVWVKRSNIYAGIVVAGLFSFLSSGFESLLANTLLFYNAADSNDHRSSLSRDESGGLAGIMCLIVFWCGVALSRLSCVAIYRRLWRNNYLLTCFLVPFVILGCLLVFAFSFAANLVCFFGVGLFTGFLSPNLFCWFNDQLSPTMWFGTYWITVEQLARAFVPLLVSSFVDRSVLLIPSSPSSQNDTAMAHSIASIGLHRASLIAALVLLVFLCVTTIFGRKMVVESSRLYTGSGGPSANGRDFSSTMTRRLKSSNGQIIEYRKHVDDEDDDDGFASETE